MSELRRVFTVTPGYDFRRDPDPRKRQYGCACDYWNFAVTDGEEGALSLCVSSGRYPDLGHHEQSSGCDLALHTAFPLYEESVADGPAACSYIGKCYSSNSSLYAIEWFNERRHLVSEFVPPTASTAVAIKVGEEFWADLEAEFWQRMARARAEKTTNVKCPTCDGRGLVESASTTVEASAK